MGGGEFDSTPFTVRIIDGFCCHSLMMIYVHQFVDGFSTKHWHQCITVMPLRQLLSMTSLIWCVFLILNFHCSCFNREVL